MDRRQLATAMIDARRELADQLALRYGPPFRPATRHSVQPFVTGNTSMTISIK